MNAKRDRSGGDPYINLTSIPSGTGAGQQRTFTTDSDGNSIANASAIFSSMDQGSLNQFVGKAEDGSLFGTWRISSYSAGTSGASGSATHKFLEAIRELPGLPRPTALHPDHTNVLHDNMITTIMTTDTIVVTTMATCTPITPTRPPIIRWAPSA